MRPFSLSLALLALAASLIACQRFEGESTTQTRTVEAFNSIELRGAATLDVLIGPQQSLVVEGDSQMLEQLQTTVRNERLVVESHSRWFLRTRDPGLKVRVTVPELRALELNGAGRISINGFTGGATTLVLSGAGDVEASGRVDTLTARVNGAGRVDLSRLQATDAEVAVNGAGSLDVNVEHQLNATLNGVGSIDYVGKPAVLNSTINGVGSIGPR